MLQRLAGLRARELAAEDPRNIDDIEHYLRHQLRKAQPQRAAHRGGAVHREGGDNSAHPMRLGGSFLYAATTGGSSNANSRMPPRLKSCARSLRRSPATDTPLSREMLVCASDIHDDQALLMALRPLGAFIVHDDSGFRVFHNR